MHSKLNRLPRCLYLLVLLTLLVNVPIERFLILYTILVFDSAHTGRLIYCYAAYNVNASLIRPEFVYIKLYTSFDEQQLTEHLHCIVFAVQNRFFVVGQI